MQKRSGSVENLGLIIDVTFVEGPKQRNSRDENKDMKETKKAPDDGSDAKKRQKDVGADWTKKNKETYYGYKCHAVVSSLLNVIECYTVL